MSVSAKAWTSFILAAITITGATVAMTRGNAPTLTTAEVVRGEYVDIVEIRGQVRPQKSIIVTAPMQSGELQILKIVKNGSAIEAGEVVIEFDGSVLQRTIVEKRSELKQATAEADQAKARANIGVGGNQMALLTARYDVERAKLDTIVVAGTVSRVDEQRAALTLSDAEQRQKQVKVKDDADTRANNNGLLAQAKRIAKIQADLAKAELGLQNLQVLAPAKGVVNIMPNYRNNTGGGSAPEFRAGDAAFPGAEILELPDLTTVRLEAKLDESDRGRLQAGQHATVRVDAIADHEFQTTVSSVSMLAKVDSSSWPPVKNFSLTLAFKDADNRLRPGMSAAGRIAVGRLPDMLMVPTEAVFIVDGRPSVYVLKGRKFVAVPVAIVRRGREQVAIKASLNAGDRVALTKPAEDGRSAAK